MVKRQNRIRNLIQLLLINMSISCCVVKKIGIKFLLACRFDVFAGLLEAWAGHSWTSCLIGFLINSNLNLSAALLSQSNVILNLKTCRKNYDKLTMEGKEIFKLLSGWTKKTKNENITKSYESRNSFFFWLVGEKGISFQVQNLLRWYDRQRKMRTEKTTSEIRKQIKYIINYLYFHNGDLQICCKVSFLWELASGGLRTNLSLPRYQSCLHVYGWEDERSRGLNVEEKRQQKITLIVFVSFFVK